MSSNTQPRVVVTGMGALTPLGLDVATTWEAMVAGRSGVGPITQFDPSGWNVKIACEVKNFDPTQFMDPKEARRRDRFEQLRLHPLSAGLRPLGQLHRRSSGQRLLLTLVRPVSAPAKTSRRRVSVCLIRHAHHRRRQDIERRRRSSGDRTDPSLTALR